MRLGQKGEGLQCEPVRAKPLTLSRKDDDSAAVRSSPLPLGEGSVFAALIGNIHAEVLISARRFRQTFDRDHPLAFRRTEDGDALA